MEFDNQSWSESDVFQLTPNDWTIEYEIKTSIQDLKSDFNKTLWYNHVVMPKHKLMLDGKRFNRFYFVIPIEFIKHNVMNMIPNKYGIITYDLTAEKQNIFKYYRKAKILHKNKITNRNYVINAVIKKYYFIYIKYIEQQIKTKEKTKCEEKMKDKILEIISKYIPSADSYNFYKNYVDVIVDPEYEISWVELNKMYFDLWYYNINNIKINLNMLSTIRIIFNKDIDV